MRRVLVLVVAVLVNLAPAAAGSTNARPSTASLRHLSAEVAHDTLVNSPSRSAFFPEGPYVAMKTGLLPSPNLDWTDRLWAFYQLDVASAHHFLALHGPVHYAGYRVTASSISWIPPRDCENLFGYWHLPGVRLEFRGPRGVVSFLVASLISWRGQWYVVHLGPNPRALDAGEVDAPLLGAGLPGPAGGC
ncbi:MAG: hypothetical protein KGR42_05365 [Acidobacteria bacterium]|nr:hypothetical protein [Acidobacteriota bacterium]